MTNIWVKSVNSIIFDIISLSKEKKRAITAIFSPPVILAYTRARRLRLVEWGWGSQWWQDVEMLSLLISSNFAGRGEKMLTWHRRSCLGESHEWKLMDVHHQIPSFKGYYHVTFLEIQNAPWIMFSHMLINAAAKKNVLWKNLRDVESSSWTEFIFSWYFLMLSVMLWGSPIPLTTYSHLSLVQKWRSRNN